MNNNMDKEYNEYNEHNEHNERVNNDYLLVIVES